MKNSGFLSLTTAFLVGLGTLPSLSAAVILGSDGIIMAGTGRITEAPIIKDFSAFSATESWLYPNAGYANVIAPVGQFTGFNDDGTPIAYLDLVPLRTSSITVVDSGANTIFSAGPNGIDFGSIMSVDSDNVLSLFKSDGTTSGISFNPNTGQIDLLGTASGIYAGGTPVFTLGTTGNLDFGTRSLSIANTSASTSSSTGALTVLGGIGAAKDSYFNGVRVGSGGVLGNTVVGYSALTSASGGMNSAFGAVALSSNTTGASNSAFGYASLYLNVSGAENSAFGVNSLFVNTSGGYNSALGRSALGFNTSGNYNSSLGWASLGGNGTGSKNVGIGYNAGRYRGTTGVATLADPINSIYIGAESRGFSNDDENSIVIGAFAIGEGANTTVIGTSATTRTHLYGTVEASAFKAGGVNLATETSAAAIATAAINTKLNSAVVIGGGTASGLKSTGISEGYAYGDYAVALSSGTAQGNFSSAMSWGMAIGEGSVAMAGGSTTGDFATALSGGSAGGHYSVALASGTTSGNNAVGIGSGAHAAEDNSFAVGAEASGYASVALQGTATGQYSIAMSTGRAEGSGSSALSGGQSYAYYSVAAGEGTKAYSFSSAVFGTYNDIGAELEVPDSDEWNDLETAFSIGNGTYEGDRSNAVSTIKNGQTTLTNKAWKANSANPLADPTSTTDSGGEALVVEGHTRLKGKVIIDEPQGDISMGIYQ